MAFSVEIGIGRLLPVINGFVSIPDGQAFLRTKLTPLDVLDLIPGSTLVRMGARGSTNVSEITVLDPTALSLAGAARLQSRLWIRLPEFDRLAGPPQDHFAVLREAAEV